MHFVWGNIFLLTGGWVLHGIRLNALPYPGSGVLFEAILYLYHVTGLKVSVTRGQGPLFIASESIASSMNKVDNTNTKALK
jgi:hypothetical protein